ncbi:hypothetical protein [Albimonas pacifica]|uniref:Uncharacterized protein n=1 Tax=Albimonas pacifica TaxID=1114924 RepID=A0A1I3IS21_9RHOB|nr:hypothetical protein [Albimonas pacifica]SFI50748.1 hypothetical protein SAMN05216258_107197 [Albimonas pacifica]
MSRLNGPASPGGGPLHARQRYSTARVVTALLFGAAAAGMAALHFRFVPLEEIHDPGEIYMALGACGAIAGWKWLGAHLGRGLGSTVRAALVSAVAAGVLFSLAAGARSVVAAYGFSHFATAEALFMHLIKKAVEMGELLVASPAAIPSLLAAVGVGLLGELARRAWDRVVIEPT